MKSLKLLATVLLALANGATSFAKAQETSLDLNTFLSGVGQARTFDDLTAFLRSRPLSKSSVMGLLSSVDGTPRSAAKPEVYSKVGDVWTGMGGKLYDVIVVSPNADRPFLYFRLTKGDGRLIINDDPTLTVEKIRAMSDSALYSWNENFNKQECYGCHKGRLLIEAQDQPRRFVHENLRFKDELAEKLITASEQSQIEQFLSRANGPADPRYAAIYNSLSKNNAPSAFKKLFDYRDFVGEILSDNAKEARRKLDTNENFNAYKLSMLAALSNRNDFLQIFAKESGRSVMNLKEEFDQTTKSQAIGLSSAKRNRLTSLVKAVFDQASVELKAQSGQIDPENALLLSEDAIVDIGPRLLDLVIEREAYDKLPQDERRNFVATDQLARKDRSVLRKLTERGRSRMETRAKFSMVAKMLTNDKFFHLTQMSSSLRPSAETQSSNSNSLDLLMNEVLKGSMHRAPTASFKRALKTMPVDELVKMLTTAPMALTHRQLICRKAY